MRRSAKSNSTEIQLKTGILQVNAKPSHIPLRKLIGYSSRINSKRGFLFVSKILGKHYPVTPVKMAWSYRSLARLIDRHLNKSRKSLWIGMAETATGLGYGVYSSACEQGLNTGLFLQTTRYLLDDHKRFEFVEAHSHASDFFLYHPTDSKDLADFQMATQLVLIDDEISTGATFTRLIERYQEINFELESVIIVSLVNFANKKHRNKVEEAIGIPVKWVSLIEGEWVFTPDNPDVVSSIDHQVKVVAEPEPKNDILAWPGRTGISELIKIDENTLSELFLLVPNQSDKRPVLVLGTGECNSPAYLLGRMLEQLCYPVKVQATTRSPIVIDGDISSAFKFKDNYQEGIHNFLYNVNPDDYRAIVFCHETPLVEEEDSDEMSFKSFIKSFNGISAYFSCGNSNSAQFTFCRP